jgi:phosphomannomutase/phosphoglucomutase
MVLAGEAIYGATITALYERIQSEKFTQGQGSYQQQDLRAAYLERIVGDVKLKRPMKIVIDCGNGVAGAFAGDLYRQLGCEVK